MTRISEHGMLCFGTTRQKLEFEKDDVKLSNKTVVLRHQICYVLYTQNLQ